MFVVSYFGGDIWVPCTRFATHEEAVIEMSEICQRLHVPARIDYRQF